MAKEEEGITMAMMIVARFGDIDLGEVWGPHLGKLDLPISVDGEVYPLLGDKTSVPRTREVGTP